MIEFLCIFAVLAISMIGLVVFPDSFASRGSAFMLYFVVFARMIPPAKSLATTYYQMRKGMGAAARIYEIIDAEEEKGFLCLHHLQGFGRIILASGHRAGHDGAASKCL